MDIRKRSLRSILFLSIVFVFCFLVSTAYAREKPKIVRYATGPVGGANHAMAVALSDIGSRKSNYKLEVTPTAGEVFVGQLNRGEGFDIGNLVSITQADARDGLSPFKEPHKNLRLITLGSPFMGSFLVRDDSDIRVPSDLKGKKITGDYAAQPAMKTWLNCLLANAGLTLDDVQIVPVPSSAKGVEAFMEGRVDSACCMPIMPVVVEADAKIGARFISLDTSSDAVNRMRKVSPVVGLLEIKKGAAIKGPTYMETFYNGIIGSSHIQEDVAYTIVKLINENMEELKTKHGGFKQYALINQDMPLPIPYHSSAVKYFKETGLWTNVMEQKQKEAEETVK